MTFSVFMLFLYILFGIGLTGICARRTKISIRQSCHRSSLARMMMSGVGFYFIFGWIILLLSTILIIPGIGLRHLGCKPAIELEKNDIFLVI